VPETVRDVVGDGAAAEGSGEGSSLLTPNEITEAARIRRAYELTRVQKKSVTEWFAFIKSVEMNGYFY